MSDFDVRKSKEFRIAVRKLGIDKAEIYSSHFSDDWLGLSTASFSGKFKLKSGGSKGFIKVMQRPNKGWIVE